MYENNRKHYRVAKREIYEDPCEGIYVTKEEQKKCFILTLGLICLSFICLLPLSLRRR